MMPSEEVPMKVVTSGTSGEAKAQKRSELESDDSPVTDAQMGAPHNMPHSMPPYAGFYPPMQPWMFPPYAPPPMMPMYPGMYPSDPYWYQANMGMQTGYCAPKGKGCRQAKGGRGWPQGGGKGGAGRSQRGASSGGNMSGKGRPLQQEMLPHSTLQMDAQWKQKWEDRFKKHDKMDTDAHGNVLEELLEELKGNVWDASIHKDGCHVVQMAMKEGTIKHWPNILNELHGRVWDAVEHPQANFVLQTIIEVGTRSSCSFIIEECQGKAVELAKHRYGCRILCRITEHLMSSCSEAQTLIDSVLADQQVVNGLCCHNFGHHVIQQIMEKGYSEHRKIIAAVLASDLIKMAQSRHASYIIESAFDVCDEDDKKTLLEKLLAERCIIDLAKHQFGGFVVKKLAGKDEGKEEQDSDESDQDDGHEGEEEAFQKKTQQEVQALLQQHKDELLNDKNGKKVFDDIFGPSKSEDHPEQKDEERVPP